MQTLSQDIISTKSNVSKPSPCPPDTTNIVLPFKVILAQPCHLLASSVVSNFEPCYDVPTSNGGVRVRVCLATPTHSQCPPTLKNPKNLNFY